MSRQGTIEKRFWSKVHKTETCWLWSGKPTTTGYGTIKRNKGAKLTAQHVLEIRARHLEGQRALAREFGVSHTQIGNILRKKSWGYLWTTPTFRICQRA